ncbi:MAG: hypothetical protein LH481_08940 [Burkholderiales bacterium]|nr:hypothetical protein [Burkholderiales bacterium]
MSHKKNDGSKRRGSLHDRENQRSPLHVLRSEIAYQAARLIAEDGMHDVATAIQKAARQLGTTSKNMLPDNVEVDAALRLYQSLFQVSSQPQECLVLQRTAADTMRWLGQFSPWLVGPILTGTANLFSTIELEVVTHNPKQLELFFLNEGTPFKTQIKLDRKMKTASTRKNMLVYEFSFNEFPVIVTCFSHHAMRAAHHTLGDLRRADAQLKDVEALLSA